MHPALPLSLYATREKHTTPRRETKLPGARAVPRRRRLLRRFSRPAAPRPATPSAAVTASRQAAPGG
jgi:hypothetical protein